MRNVEYPLQISYKIDPRAFKVTALGPGARIHLAQTPRPGKPELDGAKNVQIETGSGGAKERPGTMILPCPSCRATPPRSYGSGELVLICPICRTRWDWSPPRDETPRSGMDCGERYAGQSEGDRISTNFGKLYRLLTKDGLVDEVSYNEAGPLVHITKSFAVQREAPLSL